ncbi:hypothetical protein Tco_0002716 [Tanacetum coccineum]
MSFNHTTLLYHRKDPQINFTHRNSIESSSLNSKERELKLMQLEERKLHSNCMAWFKELKIHLKTLHNNRFSVGRNKRPYKIAFRIIFHVEYQTFSEKMYHNLNQLQWQLERKNLHSCDPKTCLDVLRTLFKEFFDSKKVNALDFQNKCWQKDVKDYTRCKPKTYRHNLLQYLDVLNKLIDERQESLVPEGTTLEANLSTGGTALDASSVTEGAVLEACLVTEDATLEACLVTEGIAIDDNLVTKESTYDFVTSLEQPDESRSSRNDADVEKILVDTVDSDIKYADIRPSYDSDTMSKNNSNIISDIPNLDPDRGKEEHDDVNYEKQCALFASLINNLKCDVEKCNEVNREAQQVNALLTNELKRYKGKEKHFAKDKTTKYEYCKKISF